MRRKSENAPHRVLNRLGNLGVFQSLIFDFEPNDIYCINNMFDRFSLIGSVVSMTMAFDRTNVFELVRSFICGRNWLCMYTHVDSLFNQSG